jgi:hypothetical protein
MNKIEILRFTNSIILLSKLLVIIEDKFFKQKLYEKIVHFITVFVNQASKQVSDFDFKINNKKDSQFFFQLPQHNVAQYQLKELVNSTNNLIDFLEYLAHTSKNNTVSFLIAQRSLLRFKLYILQQHKNKNTIDPEKIAGVSNSSGVESKMSKAEIIKSLTPKNNDKKDKIKTNSTKDKILNYIKKRPEVRARDILFEFSSLSNRTVKRNLKELVDEGFLKKISEKGAVYYLIND